LRHNQTATLREVAVVTAVMPVYKRKDVAFERGEGCWLEATDGRRFLDYTAGIAVDALGHAHPHLVAALTEQAQKLWHVSNLFRIPGQERLAERLVAATFADTVFFTNSGAEAVEGGIKLIRKHFAAKGQARKHRIVTFSSAFHGRTMTTISAAQNPAHVEGFGPLTQGFDQVAFGNLNELRNAITEETAGILLEPVQGEGGVRPADAGFLQGLRQVCDEYDLLLFYDEVQCGMGRTGKLFAHEWDGVAPDVMAVAKGLGGGFPVGAVLATEDAASGMVAGTHGSTFGGNPLAMAVGNAVLDLVDDEGFLATVVARGEALRAALRTKLVEAYPDLVAEVRGAGLMLGVKFAQPGANAAVSEAAFAEGLLTVTAADNVLRIVPPLVITEDDIETGTDMLARACATVQRTQAAQ
jgi:acetylornithine/N-succinyldiaminopimelate aminotransferase